MTIETWIAFAIMNFVCSLTPGPNAAVVLAQSARRGLAGGICALSGVILARAALAMLAILIVLGAPEIVQLDGPTLHLIGAIVLLALGMGMLRARTVPAPQLAGCGHIAPAGHIRTIFGAFLIALSNPLSVIFFVSVAPVFLGADTLSPQAVGAFLSAALLPCAAAYTPYLAMAKLNRPGTIRFVDRSCGTALCALGLWGIAQSF
ncbi:LysE family translocator [Roseovarius sp. Pro17]|uniref:LysE family translocator n=1 Tax=Roseovarius sp. Pro17 TaxID=3108175 RepID=UPI002D7A2CDD|nr:LysE family transporter [Roseovarius sp. Pro17]